MQTKAMKAMMKPRTIPPKTEPTITPASTKN